MEKHTPAQFVVDRLKMGISQSEVKQNLVAVGWNDEDADVAISSALLSLGAPAPEVGTRMGARKASSTLDVVLNLFSFILLGMIATALGVLYFEIINKWFPDPLAYRNGMGNFSTTGVKYAIASLIVAFPIYILVVRQWFRRFREDAERVESKLTKWLTYLVLLITSVTIVGDLIATIFSFLQGELSPRFVLKALTILVIAGTIFGFYVLERRKIQYGQDIPRRIFQNVGWGMLIVILLGIILGFMASGSPKTERMRGFDAQRAGDLSQLAGCINNFTVERKQLPESLASLETSTNYQYCASRVVDPETGVPYEYRVIEAERKNGIVTEAVYELCATFSLLGAKEEMQTTMPYGYSEGG